MESKMKLHELIAQIDADGMIKEYKESEFPRLKASFGDLQQKYLQSEQARKELEEKLKAKEDKCRGMGQDYERSLKESSELRKQYNSELSSRQRIEQEKRDLSIKYKNLEAEKSKSDAEIQRLERKMDEFYATLQKIAGKE